jgi:hypothetical protein
MQFDMQVVTDRELTDMTCQISLMTIETVLRIVTIYNKKVPMTSMSSSERLVYKTNSLSFSPIRLHWKIVSDSLREKTAASSGRPGSLAFAWKRQPADVSLSILTSRWQEDMEMS